MVFFVAAALRRRVLHGGGLFGVVVPAPFASLSTPDHPRDLLTAGVRIVGGTVVCVFPSPLSSSGVEARPC
jgi:hypothetical protein